MSDLYDLLAPYFDNHDSSPRSNQATRDSQTTAYLNRLSTLSLGDLTTTEPASLLHAAQSHIRNLQALSKRSHKAVIASSSHLANLATLLPSLGSEAHELKNAVPHLESAAADFAQKYDRSTENEVLDRRKRAMLLSRNVDRVSDVLELPSLLSSAINTAQAPGGSSAATSSASYTSALDLHAHIKRLSSLYPQSELVSGISWQADAEIENLTTILITSLQSPTLKLAGAMRTIGWLRRVAPDLADDEYGASRSMATSTKSMNFSSAATNSTGALGSLFLVCRLRTLNATLDALEPLRDLADQETTRRAQTSNGVKLKQQTQSSAIGNHSERYLKRYIEIFREQSFAIISMYKSIFPFGLPNPDIPSKTSTMPDDPLLPLPPPLASFTTHLVTKLTSTLRAYLPNITDSSSRESLLTQVLYCAGSLGRLGADFGLMIALLAEDDGSTDDGSGRAGEEEWVQVMKKHRTQASRLEVLARGVGSGGRKGSAVDVSQIGVVSPAA